MLTLPTHPLFDAPARGNPLEFLDEIYPAKTRGMGLPYGENFIILTSTVFSMIHPSDRQTDRRTIAYALWHMLSRVISSAAAHDE